MKLLFQEKKNIYIHLAEMSSSQNFKSLSSEQSFRSCVLSRQASRTQHCAGELIYLALEMTQELNLRSLYIADFYGTTLL